MNEKLKELTGFGIRRISYLPYDMDIALAVVFRIGKSIDPGFILAPEIKEVYKKLVQYFHADPAFPGELTKGIMLMGPTGTGKTLAMKVMAIYREIDNTKFILHNQVFKMNYEVVDVSIIINSFIGNFFDGIKIYMNRYVACLDDIGAETAYAKHYGNKIDVISHILSERYSKRLLTFGTSNYPLEILETKYDDRLISRMYAMFNFITMKGDDFRKTNKNPR
jgi:hypothetical protein